jgi:hypothetical protein
VAGLFISLNAVAAWVKDRTGCDRLAIESPNLPVASNQSAGLADKLSAKKQRLFL